MSALTVVMYHYVRELPYTRYPEIKGLLLSQFKEQLSYMNKYYQFVTIQDVINAVSCRGNLPSNAILLTFDDAYADHYNNVFPLLEGANIQGCFFPPSKAILNHEVLNVNKIHFVLAAIKDKAALIEEIYKLLNELRTEYNLFSNDYYFNKLAIENRFDPKEVIFIKRLLQNELPLEPRKIIVHSLFKKYVTEDESAFSRELYMDIDQIKCMARNGMYFGSHGYDHFWLDSLSLPEQEKEVDLSIEFLKMIYPKLNEWVICYPYGAYNDKLLTLLKAKNCMLGFTTEVGLAEFPFLNPLTISRLDTNDLPKLSSSSPNDWTNQIIENARTA